MEAVLVLRLRFLRRGPLTALFIADGEVELRSKDSLRGTALPSWSSSLSSSISLELPLDVPTPRSAVYALIVRLLAERALPAPATEPRRPRLPDLGL